MTANTASVGFTLRDVVEQVRAVAAERPDFIYTVQPQQTVDGFLTPRCLYRHGQKPGCIMGQALDRLDYVVPDEYEGNNIQMVVARIYGYENGEEYSNLDSRWLRMVQAKQDRGLPWGQAVAETDAYYADPLNLDSEDDYEPSLVDVL